MKIIEKKILKGKNKKHYFIQLENGKWHEAKRVKRRIGPGRNSWSKVFKSSKIPGKSVHFKPIREILPNSLEFINLNLTLKVTRTPIELINKFTVEEITKNILKRYPPFDGESENLEAAIKCYSMSINEILNYTGPTEYNR